MGKGQIGGDLGLREEDYQWSDNFAGIIAEDTAKIDVEGKTTLIGGSLIADDGQMHLDTKALEVSSVNIKDQAKDLNIGANLKTANLDKNPNNDTNSYGNIQYSNKGHDKEGVINATITSGNIIVDGEQKTKAELEAAGINQDASKIIQITKDETWETSFEAELVNIGVAANQVKDITNAIQSLTARVPERIKADGPNAEALYRKAIANGLKGEDLETFINSKSFKNAVRIRNRTEQAALKAGGWDKISSDALSLILQEERAVIAGSIYLDPNCQSGNAGIGVCPELYNKLTDKDKVDLSDPDQILGLIKDYERLIGTALEQGKQVSPEIEALYSLAIQCALSYDRDHQQKDPNAGSIIEDYLSVRRDNIGDVYIKGQAAYNIYDIQLIEATKIAKLYYDKTHSNPKATEAEREEAKDIAESLIQASFLDIKKNLSQLGVSKFGLQTAYNKLADDLLSAVEKGNRSWLVSLLTASAYEDALRDYEQDSFRPILDDRDSFSGKLLSYSLYGDAFLAAEEFEKGNTSKGLSILTSNVIPSNEILLLKLSFKKFLKDRHVKEEEGDKYLTTFLKKDPTAQKILLKASASNRRKQAGAASHSGNLPRVREGDRWLKGSQGNAGKVPAQIADKLSGKEFKNFDSFRRAFWKEVAKDPVLSKQFKPSSVTRMKKGNAPYAAIKQQVGGRKVYELDHMQEIQHGGNVYDMNNIIIRTPFNHIKKGK